VELAAQRVEARVLLRRNGLDFNLLGGDAAAGTARGFRRLPLWIGFHLIYQGKDRGNCSARIAGLGCKQLTLSEKLSLVRAYRE
jgi:hypothetical protein